MMRPVMTEVWLSFLPQQVGYGGYDIKDGALRLTFPSGDTPAKQKQRNGDYSKIPGEPGNKSGPPAQQGR
jgi:hypothetical protein